MGAHLTSTIRHPLLDIQINRERALSPALGDSRAL